MKSKILSVLLKPLAPFAPLETLQQWFEPEFKIPVCTWGKAYIERRHCTVSPLNSYFCPKWAFQAARPVHEKSPVLNYEQPFSLVFSTFHGQNFFLNFFIYILASSLKSCLIEKLKKFEKNLGSIFFGLKIVFFRASCFGYYSKGCLSATPSFSLLCSFLWIVVILIN